MVGKNILLIFLLFNLLNAKANEVNKTVITYYSTIKPNNECSSYNFKYKYLAKMSNKEAEKYIQRIVDDRVKYGIYMLLVYKVYYGNFEQYKKEIPYKTEVYNGYNFPSYIIYMDKKGRPIKTIDNKNNIISSIKYKKNKKILYDYSNNLDCYCIFDKNGKLKKSTCDFPIE